MGFEGAPDQADRGYYDGYAILERERAGMAVIEFDMFMTRIHGALH
jgi:hypothetical protein